MSLYELVFGPSPQTLEKHADCFKQSDSDPNKRSRTVPMEVLSLGMPRTGTASMYTALGILGYETYHGFRAFANIKDYDLWNPAYELKYFQKPSRECPSLDRNFFDRVLGHCSAVTDMPPAAFAEELMEAYPDAKVILVQRGENEWMRSFENVFVATYDSSLVRWIAWLEPNIPGRLIRGVTRGVAEGVFRAHTTEEFRSNAKGVYREHYARIRKIVKERREKGRLLEYSLGSGWEPLCHFLGKDVPESVAFPKVNETAMIQEKIRVMLMVGVRTAMVRMMKILGPFFVLVMISYVTRNAAGSSR